MDDSFNIQKQKQKNDSKINSPSAQKSQILTSGDKSKKKTSIFSDLTILLPEWSENLYISSWIS